MSVRPDWNSIASTIGEHLSDAERHDAWTKECKKWLEAVGGQYDETYAIFETENFMLLSNESSRYMHVFSEFLERTLQQILKTLDGIASDAGFGKHAAIIFGDIDQYYDYVSLFYSEEGDFGLSSGMYINEGYGHFVFPSQDITFAEPIAVHELTHACLAHLPIPTWLNEGLAVSMEEAWAGHSTHLSNDLMTQHVDYWNENAIQEFWNGSSFYAADEGQELSYSLAHLLVRALSKDYETFKAFVNHAHHRDSGYVAFESYYGGSLASFVSGFLGEGNWKSNKITPQ